METPIQIPVPPSANNLWRIFGNRQHKTKAYRDWLKHTSELLRESVYNVDGAVRVDITIVFGKGFLRSRDIDNCAKPILDALKPCKLDRNGAVISEGAGIIEDDSIEYVREITMRVLPAHDKKSEAECWVRVSPINNAEPLVPTSKKR